MASRAFEKSVQEAFRNSLFQKSNLFWIDNKAFHRLCISKEPCMYHKRGHEDFLSVVSDCPWMAPSLAVEKQKQIAAAQHGLALSVKTIQRVAL